MAKTPRAALTRLAATVTARYYATSGATDGFYLDGRLSGRREHRAADITLDREERGFFYAVFAHLAGAGQDEAASSVVRKSLDRIGGEVRQTGRNIDAEINELAECAVSVAGRITLQHDGVRQPYFAGVIVKDSEIAAVTMGNGCAYLYRNDVLYPLTADDYPLEAINFSGKPVQGLDVYCAGVAGTVRYSNIAQLQVDDCILICNKEVMEALGQREVLRMLYDAEDQADAAGMIITAASAKLPGVPLQCMITFVESITASDRTARINLGRIQAEAALAQVATAAVKPEREAMAIEDEAADYQPEPVKAKTIVQPKNDSRQMADINYEDEGFGDEPNTAGRGRRIALYVVIALVCIGCIYAIISMVSGGKAKVTTTALQTTSTTNATTATSEPSMTTTLQTTTIATTTATTTAAGQTYTVVSGDSLWSIAIKFYGSGAQSDIDRIMAANKMTDIDLQIGQKLIIPPKP